VDPVQLVERVSALSKEPVPPIASGDAWSAGAPGPEIRRRRRSLPARVAYAMGGELHCLHLRLRLLNTLLFFLPRSCGNFLRTALYRLCGMKIGHGSLILGSMELVGRGRIWEKLHVGEDCQITTPLYADLNADITIGDRVAIGHHVVLVTTAHDMAWQGKRCGIGHFEPIRIEAGSWIGAGAMILPGVTIGHGSVVAAAAVVAQDVPPNTLVGGVPARPLKALPTQEGSL
jgi:maltose O-acetyltransferase